MSKAQRQEGLKDSLAAPASEPNPQHRGSPTRTESSGNKKQDFRVSPPIVSLPKGGGAIQGIGEKFTANPLTGKGSLLVPITTSPGRAGFGPQLTLSYDCGAGDGPFGLGWSLSVPSITRKTDKGLPQYLDKMDSDTFFLASAEDLVPVLDTDGHRLRAQTLTVYGKIYLLRRYRPRIEGLFARIEYWRAQDDPADVFWRTISADNVTSWLGRTPESRVVDPEVPRRVFQWMLRESHDDKGNVAVYHYNPEDGAGVERTQVFEANRPARQGQRHAATYLSRITYGNQTPYVPTLEEGPAGWQGPPTTPSDCLLEVCTWRLCRRVLTIHRFPDASGASADLPVNSTDIVYDEPTAAPLDDRATPGYTVLCAVRYRSYQCSRDADQSGSAGGYAWRELPPLTFEYSRPKVGMTIRRLATRDLPNLPLGAQGAGYQWVYLHGEGLSGVLSEQGGAWHYAPNRGGG